MPAPTWFALLASSCAPVVGPYHTLSGEVRYQTWVGGIQRCEAVVEIAGEAMNRGCPDCNFLFRITGQAIEDHSDAACVLAPLLAPDGVEATHGLYLGFSDAFSPAAYAQRYGAGYYLSQYGYGYHQAAVHRIDGDARLYEIIEDRSDGPKTFRDALVVGGGSAEGGTLTGRVLTHGGDPYGGATWADDHMDWAVDTTLSAVPYGADLNDRDEVMELRIVVEGSATLNR